LVKVKAAMTRAYNKESHTGTWCHVFCVYLYVRGRHWCAANRLALLVRMYSLASQKYLLRLRALRTINVRTTL
jgi:hypothetical protein